MSPSTIPPDGQSRVGQFNPFTLDRTVIALPLLLEMKQDLKNIAELKERYPEAQDKFTVAIEYDDTFPGGTQEARLVVLDLLKEAAAKAERASEHRLASTTAESTEQKQRRHDALLKAIAEQSIDPPLTDLPAFSLGVVHASVLRRLIAANDRADPRPLAHVHPRRFEVMIDLNLEHPGGRAAAREWVLTHIGPAIERAGVRDAGQGFHPEKDQPGSQYLFATIEARVIHALVELDLEEAKNAAELLRANARDDAARSRIDAAKLRAIFHIWPDFEVTGFINKSIATVKCDAAQNSFSAAGGGVTWAVMDSGIDSTHQHFAKHANVDALSTYHKDFTVDGGGPFEDENGHGTHVAGIIAGEWRTTGVAGEKLPLAITRFLKKDSEDVELQETHLESISGMAPRCKLVSLRVLDENGKGSVSNLIAAINHIQEINGYGRRLLIHGVNMSLGYNFEPEWFACGQSPLCAEVDRLVKSGVVVVVAAGNTGFGTLKSTIGATSAGMSLTINDPGNSDLAITVGSTHRDMPHVYGVSYFSSKGPTGDGRLKPDLVAPGEKIVSCAAAHGRLKAEVAGQIACDYVETSGTSMAAPHVSGAIAAFLSVRGEFIGKPEIVKNIFLSTCTDLRRDRYFQGAGLVDLMRAIQSV